VSYAGQMAAGTGPKQSIFISYSHDDAAFVRDCQRSADCPHLRSLKLPT
jgi:hypothetical protein